jgi:CRISPR-associated protein Csx1
MKILIEIWGNFEKWKEVNYYYGNENIKDSKTTFPLLFQCINPSSVFVIVSDTLIDNYDEEYENYSHIIDQVTIETKSFIDDINKKFNTNLNDYNIIVAPGIGRFEKIEVKGNPHNFYAFIYTKLSCFITEQLEEIFSNEEIEVYLDITHGINYMTMMSYRAVKDILSILA